MRRKEKYFLCNPIESVESYFNMLTGYDLFLAKKILMGDILNKTEILEYKEAVVNKEKCQKVAKVEIQVLCQERCNLIKSTMISLRICFSSSVPQVDHHCLAE